MNYINSKIKNLLLLLLSVILLFGLAACSKKENKELKELSEVLFIGDLSAVKVDFSLPKQLSSTSKEVTADVTWESSNAEVIQIVEYEAGSGIDVTKYYRAKVTRPEVEEGNVIVTLTATLRVGKASVEKKFSATVLAIELGPTIRDVINSKDNSKHTVVGTVIYTHLNGYIITDGNDQIFVYDPKHEQVVGNEVEVNGEKIIRYDMPQLQNATNKTLGTKSFDPLARAVDSSVAEVIALDKKEVESYGKILRVQGRVIGNGDRSTYALEYEGQVLAIYNLTTNEGKAELKEEKDSGKFVEIVVITFDNFSNGNYWRVLYFPGTIKEAVEPVVTDQEKVEKIKNKLEIDFSNKIVMGNITLPVTDSRYNGSTILWTSDKPEVLSNTGIVGDVTEETEVTLTAVITAGEKSETITLKVTVKVAATTVKEARETITPNDATHQLWFEGIVVGHDQYGYFVGDEHTSIYVRDPKNTVNLGDKVEVKGLGKVYYGGKTLAEAIQFTIQVDGEETGYSVKVLATDQANPMPAPLVKEVKDFTSVAKTVEGTFGADFYGQFVKVTGKLVEYGSFSNLHLQVGNDRVVIYHRSIAEPMNQLQTLLGKEVTLTLLPVDQHKTDGWRLTFIGRPGDIEVNLTESEKLDILKSELDLIVKNDDNVSEDLIFKTESMYDLIFQDVHFEWTTNNLAVIDATGKVDRGDDDVNVEITIKVFFGDVVEPVQTYTLTVTVKSTSALFWTVETFDSYLDKGTTYSSGSFVGVNNIKWNYVGGRGDLNGEGIDGSGMMIGNQVSHSGGQSSIKATISGGIGDFKLDTRKAYTGSGVREIELFINGTSKGKFKLDNSNSNVQVFEVKGINIAGEFTLEIKLVTPGTGRSQINIDNLSWTNFIS